MFLINLMSKFREKKKDSSSSPIVKRKHTGRKRTSPSHLINKQHVKISKNSITPSVRSIDCSNNFSINVMTMNPINFKNANSK